MNKSYGSVESERFQQYMQMQRLCLVALFLLGCHHADAFVLPSSNGANRWISSLPYRRVFTFQRTTGSSALYYKGDSGTSEKDFYSVLGITKTAGETEVKGAYRKLAKLYHPGKATIWVSARSGYHQTKTASLESAIWFTHFVLWKHRRQSR